MKTLSKKLFAIVLPTFLILAFANTSFAKTSKRRKKIDVERLQEKYWKAKDYKTGVVQGRKYSKSKRVRLGLEYINLLNDRFSVSDGLANVRGDLAYFVNERLSVGGFYENLDLSDNTVLKETRSQPNGQFVLDHVKATSFVGASIEFVPIYSKMSWMNDKIIYFDLSISPKVGLATYEQQVNDGSNPEQSTLLVGLDLAANIFLSKSTSVSLAYRSRFFQSEVLQFSNPSNVVNDAENNLYSFFSLGFNFYL